MQPLIAPLADHLWQSTAFLGAVAAVCVVLRHCSPRLRYWLWLAASLKFLVPLSLLVALGALFERPAESLSPVQTEAMAQVAYAFAPALSSLPADATPTVPSAWPAILLCAWAVGVIGVAGLRFRQWRSLRTVRRLGQSVAVAFPVPVVESKSLVEPGIFGIFRPVLLLPLGVRDALTPEQLATLIEHELCHLRYRDHLTAALHMAVEALFWFYPPVWWIGAKLVTERERACDQGVLERGAAAEVYAESILSVCRRYVESPLPCAPGVTGADLNTRIHEILTGRVGRPLSAALKAALALSALAAVSIPVAIGVLRAQAPPNPPEYTYGSVSVRPAGPSERQSLISPGPQGGMQGENVTAMTLLTFAFDVPASQLTGVPDWAQSERFDVTFTPDREETTMTPGMPPDELEALMGRQRQRMQAVLRDRFGLVMGSESRGQPIYTLTVAESGSILTANDDPKPFMRLHPGRVTGKAATMKMMARFLSAQLGRPVVDETQLDGGFDFALEWTPSRPLMGLNGAPVRAGSGQPPAAGDDPALAADLTEQLGLRLESRSQPVSVVVIEKIEKPSAD